MYRRLYLVCLLFIFQAGIAHAQPYTLFRENSRFRGGVMAGGNFCELIGDAYHGLSKLGLQGGGIVYANLSRNIAASMSIKYTQKGSTGKHAVFASGGPQFSDRYNLRLNYVEIPLQVWLLPYGSLQIGGGLSYARLVNSREEYTFMQPVPINQENHPFQKDDLMWLAGGGLRIYRDCYFMVQYQRSLKPVRFAGQIPLGLGSGDQLNSQLAISLMYLF